MHDLLIPEWIKDRKARQEKESLRRQSVVMAESLVRADLPAVWDEFVRELAIQVDACKLLAEVSSVKLEGVSQANDPEKAHKFTIYGSGMAGPLLYTIIRLKLEYSRPYIECLRDAEDHGKDYKIFFHLDKMGRTCFMADRELSPRMAAEYVAERMIHDLDAGLTE